MSLIKRSYSSPHERTTSGQNIGRLRSSSDDTSSSQPEIINRVDPENQKLPRSTCEWCTSTIRCKLSDLRINRRREVVFLCPVCQEYSVTDCVSLEKVKWFMKRNQKDWFNFPKK